VRILNKDPIKEYWDGEITIANGIHESVTAMLTIHLRGELLDYSMPRKVDAIQQGDSLVNQVHKLRFDMQLELLAAQEMKYARVFHRSAQPSKIEQWD
jgi:hypothetical protein